MSDDLVKMLRGRCNCNMLSTPCGSEDECRFDFRVADRIEELEAEIARLRQLVPRPDQTRDELVWRDHMRGVPLEALAKEFGVTRERMRQILKRTAERRLHLEGETDE